MAAQPNQRRGASQGSSQNSGQRQASQKSSGARQSSQRAGTQQKTAQSRQAPSRSSSQGQRQKLNVPQASTGRMQGQPSQRMQNPAMQQKMQQGQQTQQSPAAQSSQGNNGNNMQQPNKSKMWLWILIGIGAIFLIGVVIWLVFWLL